LSNVIAALTCLVLPVIFYHTYTITNPLARLWGKFMPLPEDEYFSFAFPAVVAMATGYRMPVLRLNLVCSGVVSGVVGIFMPAALKEVFFLAAHLTFVGVFYVIYSPSKKKRNIIIFVLALMLGQTIATGMFGEMVFMLACSVVLILLGKKMSFPLKVGVAVVAIFFLLVLQAVKVDYRQRTWYENTGADLSYYAELTTEKTTNPSMLFDNPNKLFFVAVRANQGWLV